MKGRKTGGVVAKDKKPEKTYAGAGSNVAKEAEARKKGGKVVGKADGMKGKDRADRPARKSGGRAGSNMNPLSSAAHGTAPKGRNIQMN